MAVLLEVSVTHMEGETALPELFPPRMNMQPDFVADVLRKGINYLRHYGKRYPSSIFICNPDQVRDTLADTLGSIFVGDNLFSVYKAKLGMDNNNYVHAVIP